MKRLFAIIGGIFVALLGGVFGINTLAAHDAKKNRAVIEVEVPEENE